MPNQLTRRERQLSEWISEAAFTNPFSSQRAELDQRITGSHRRNIPHLRDVVSRFVHDLEKRKLGALHAFGPEEAQVMRNVFLFELYHQYYQPFDELIKHQLGAGDKSVRVPFGPELIAKLRRRGFEPEEARRFLAVFYQIRRAHFFIVLQLVGRSACMKTLRHALWDAVFTHDIRWYDRYFWCRMEDFSTLILGETGCGKGVAAAAIGRSGFVPYDERTATFSVSFLVNFISLNLAQFPESLIESELFGHRKGAFTGAIDNHVGLLARCSPHGAIFLDEIGDVPVPVQIKLLQVLQERTYSPVGSREVAQFRGRVIAATNHSLNELRAKQLFRDDFYYRLCSDIIHVPSLRQRMDEDPTELDLLLKHLLDRMAAEPSAELFEFVKVRLHASVGQDYRWPGNVRELEQAVRRILLRGRYSPDTIAPDSHRQFLSEVEQGSLTAENLLADYCRMLHTRYRTFEAVAQRTALDRRTVKKYLDANPK